MVVLGAGSHDPIFGSVLGGGGGGGGHCFSS